MFRRISLTIGLGICLTARSRAEATVNPAEFDGLTRNEIELLLPDSHPYSYLDYTERLIKERDWPAALRWYQITRIRSQFYLQAHPDLPADDEPDAINVLLEQFGDILNPYGWEHPEVMIAALKSALDWDAATPNDFTSETQYKETYAQVRAHFVKQELSAEAQQKKFHLIAIGENPPPDGWLALKPIASARELAGIYKVGFGQTAITQYFNFWPAPTLADTVQIYPLSDTRFLAIARGRHGEVARGETTIVLSKDGAVATQTRKGSHPTEPQGPSRLWRDVAGGIVGRRAESYSDATGSHVKRTWSKSDLISIADSNLATPPAAPDITPEAATKAAMNSDLGIAGIMRLTVKRVGMQSGWLYLDSEENYRDPGCLVVAISPFTQRLIAAQYPGDFRETFKDKTIRVVGTAKHETIYFYEYGVKNGISYFQTQVKLMGPPEIQFVTP